MQWPILAGIPEDDARRVLQIARRRVFGRREVVFHRGDPADTLHLVHSGRFAVRINTPLGDTVMLSLIGPGETFGEIALLDDTAPRSATVVAVEKGETRAIHKLDFDALRARHPGGRRHPRDRAGAAGAAALGAAGRGALRVRGHARAAAGGRARERRRRGAAHPGGALQPGGHLARDRQPRAARGPGPRRGRVRRGRIEVLDAAAATRALAASLRGAGVVGRVRVAGQRGDNGRALEQDQQLAAGQLGVGAPVSRASAVSSSRWRPRCMRATSRVAPARALGRGVDDRAAAKALLGVPAAQGVEDGEDAVDRVRGTVGGGLQPADDAVAALAQDLLQQALLAAEMAVQRLEMPARSVSSLIPACVPSR